MFFDTEFNKKKLKRKWRKYDLKKEKEKMKK